ncbi:MAG TPA: GAF and ANTAR domain-containing protein [Nitrolancea sp.]|nr:GAF and ANTAR domain-containing protein [Nitrolancea sp.]
MDSLNHLLSATCEMFSASGAGLMMLDDGNMLCALAATDEPGRLLEGRQEELGHGPCVDTVTLGRVTSTPDLGADDRWPELLPEIPQAGVRSVFGIPIRASGLAVGALNVYRDHVHEWSDGEIAALTSYGKVLDGLLRAALQARDREELAEQLQHALNSRVVIERAVGLIMGRQNIDAVAAFNQLRDNGRRSRRKVADVAAELLNQ